LETEIKLYPNPATTHFFVSGLQRGWELRLEDLSGRQLLHKEVQSEMEQIDLQPYSTGSYLIRIYQGSNMILSQKILKQ
jgi:hypothetical protein